jgi:hypothetical protein
MVLDAAPWGTHTGWAGELLSDFKIVKKWQAGKTSNSVYVMWLI